MTVSRMCPRRLRKAAETQLKGSWNRRERPGTRRLSPHSTPSFFSCRPEVAGSRPAGSNKPTYGVSEGYMDPWSPMAMRGLHASPHVEGGSWRGWGVGAWESTDEVLASGGMRCWRSRTGECVDPGLMPAPGFTCGRRLTHRRLVPSTGTTDWVARLKQSSLR